MQKKILIIGSLAVMSMLSACAGVKYSSVQTNAQVNSMPNCSGLHMKNATWSFWDDKGFSYNVTGTCNKGMMHGTFAYYMNGEKVAKVKFVKNNEVKTSCLVDKAKFVGKLNDCLFRAQEANAAK